MKRFFVYIALSVYVFAQLKPLAVIVEDALAHTFWKMQHMATVHYENGHYHVHTELKDINEKENTGSQQKTPSSEKVIETTAQNISELTFNFKTNSILISALFHQTQEVLSGFTSIHSPPPKA